MTTSACAVHARGLELHTRQGAVYAPTTFEAPAGAVSALLGPARSGRTALLLTLAGRMRPTGGDAWIGTMHVARDAVAVREQVALGLFAGVNDLDAALTCGQHLSEASLFTRSRLTDAHGLLRRVGLGGVRDTRTGDLDTDGCMRLGIVLALVGDPRVLVVDDLDHDLELAEQAAIIDLLRGLASERSMTVLVTCVDERTAALADTVITLPAHQPREEVLADAVA